MPCRIQNTGRHHLRLDLRGGKTLAISPRLADELLAGSRDLPRLERQDLAKRIDMRAAPAAEDAAAKGEAAETSRVVDVQGIGEKSAGKLEEAGIAEIQQLVELTPEQLAELLGGSEAQAKKLLRSARKHLKELRASHSADSESKVAPND